MARDLRASVGWAALSLAGYLACLQLVDAGHGVRYQHLRPLTALGDAPVVVRVVLGVQLAVVLAGLLRNGRGMISGVARTFRPWQIVTFVVILFGLSGTASRDIAAFFLELPSATFFQLVALANVALAVRAIPPESVARIGGQLDRLFGPSVNPGETFPGGIDRFALVIAAAAALVTAALNIVIYQRHPHLLDEAVYLLQARQFAAGHVATAPPPVPEAFVFSLTDICPAGWYMVTQPGWAALLATGESIGLGWLVNPLLSALCLLAAYVLLRHMYDLRTARVATLLLACSPWFLFLGMSFMNHQATLLFGLLAALGVVWARTTGRMAWAWMGGAALGVVSLIRQLDALALAIPLGLWAIGLGGKRLRLAGVAGLVIGSMVVGAAVLPFNRILTGSARVFPMMAYTDRVFGPGSNAYGFGANRGMGWPTDPGPGHNNRDAIINADLNATAINVELFGWSIGSLLPFAALLLAGGLTRSDRNLLTITAAVFVAYYFNYFSGGPDFGGRYWFLMILPMVTLTARSIEVLGARLSETAPERAARRTQLLAGIGLLSLGALLVFMPWRAIDKYYHYRGMQPGVARLAESRAFGRDLILIRGREFPDFVSAAVYNSLDFQADQPIYAFDRNAAVRGALLEAYPDRAVWVVDGPTRTLDGFQVVAGPLTADQARALPDSSTP